MPDSNKLAGGMLCRPHVATSVGALWCVCGGVGLTLIEQGSVRRGTAVGLGTCVCVCVCMCACVYVGVCRNAKSRTAAGVRHAGLSVVWHLFGSKCHEGSRRFAGPWRRAGSVSPGAGSRGEGGRKYQPKGGDGRRVLDTDTDQTHGTRDGRHAQQLPHYCRWCMERSVLKSGAGWRTCELMRGSRGKPGGTSPARDSCNSLFSS